MCACISHATFSPLSPPVVLTTLPPPPPHLSHHTRTMRHTYLACSPSTTHPKTTNEQVTPTTMPPQPTPTLPQVMQEKLPWPPARPHTPQVRELHCVTSWVQRLLCWHSSVRQVCGCTTGLRCLCRCALTPPLFTPPVLTHTPCPSLPNTK